MATNRGERSLVTNFLLSGAATSCACLFSNPMEVVKSRFQVQGEGGAITRYPSYMSCFRSMLRDEGVQSFYKGFSAAVLYQVTMNGMRLSLYPLFKEKLNTVTGNDTSFLSNLGAGMAAGGIGAFWGSPFFLVKIRQQIQNNAQTSAKVGYQHEVSGVWHGLKSAVTESKSITGLFRGADAQIFRVCIGGGLQVSTYDKFKQFGVQTVGLREGSFPLQVLSAFGSGLVVAVGMNPMDVIASRLYNQPVSPEGKGLYYNSLRDVPRQMLRDEGMLSFFKGVEAHAMRIVPHTVLTFVFLEKFTSFYVQQQQQDNETN